MVNIQHKRIPHKVASLPHLQKKKTLNAPIRKKNLVDITT